ncbi:MAG TPA: hypothetical protein VMW79_01625 [Anaerolineae bacterium]|nr:hypothetical protein [Anaerolineae bacterium]
MGGGAVKLAPSIHGKDHMAQVMYMDQAMKIIRRVPGLRIAMIDSTNKKQRSGSVNCVPDPCVYFGDQSICRIAQNFMSDHHIVEWISSSESRVKEGTVSQGAAYQYWRPAWGVQFRQIESKIPRQLIPVLRKAAKREGFKWWRN